MYVIGIKGEADIIIINVIKQHTVTRFGCGLMVTYIYIYLPILIILT